MTSSDETGSGGDRHTEQWLGRFPKNDIISLLDVSRRYNLAESTTLDLSVGDLLEAANVEDLGSLTLGYGASAGLQQLREAIGRTCSVPPSQVLTTQGLTLGLFLLALELCRPGDEVVLGVPCFPPSRDALTGCGLAIREVRTSFDEGYVLDTDRLASLLSARTRLVSIASPQNPSGVRISEDALRRVLAAMATRCPDAYLFVDESYREATYGADPVPPSAAALHPRVITGSSTSKAYGAAGLRTGWLTVADPDLLERLTVAKLNTVISGSVLDETLAASVLASREQILRPKRDQLATCLAELQRWQESVSDYLEWVRPDAGALSCARLRSSAFGATAVKAFWESLPARELQLANGSWFGEDDRVFRIGFGYLPLEHFREALAALARALEAATPAPTSD